MDSLQAIKQRFGIIGNNLGLNRALEKSLRVSNTDISVLVIGESGVGKESIPKIKADIIKGFSRRVKLIPLFRIAIISVLFAILEVKKITEIKINRGLNRFPK